MYILKYMNKTALRRTESEEGMGISLFLRSEKASSERCHFREDLKCGSPLNSKS
jgi:hypothetical protein